MTDTFTGSPSNWWDGQGDTFSFVQTDEFCTLFFSFCMVVFGPEHPDNGAFTPPCAPGKPVWGARAEWYTKCKKPPPNDGWQPPDEAGRCDGGDAACFKIKYEKMCGPCPKSRLGWSTEGNWGSGDLSTGACAGEKMYGIFDQDGNSNSGCRLGYAAHRLWKQSGEGSGGVSPAEQYLILREIKRDILGNNNPENARCEDITRCCTGAGDPPIQH